MHSTSKLQILAHYHKHHNNDPAEYFSLEKVIGIYHPIMKYRNPMSIIILRMEQDFIFVLYHSEESRFYRKMINHALIDL